MEFLDMAVQLLLCTPRTCLSSTNGNWSTYIFRKESVLELALLSARIFTANPDQPWAEAMIIKGNKILAVGRNDEIKGLCGKNTEIMELPGRL
ncbi:MAG: hypothetical protein V3V37_00640, partial [Candidatus Adiutricales bacterium]